MYSFEVLAPFITSNWQFLSAAFLLILLFIQLYLSVSARYRQPALKNSSAPIVDLPAQQITAKDHREHPLSEFEDEKVDPSLAPPLHADDTPHVPLEFQRLPEAEMVQRSSDFYNTINQRRSVRFFSRDPIPTEVLRNVVRAAGTSPSGAHCEPWTFVVVQDPKLKSQIREIVEQEEYINYDRRMGDKWVHDLQFIKTTHEKPYLEDAAAIILVMKQPYHVDKDGVKHPHYYFEISTAVAAGILIAAIHMAGLVTVTTTPLNAGIALRELLGRPDNEKVMLLLPVGYPTEDATVPGIQRKALEDILVLK